MECCCNFNQYCEYWYANKTDICNKAYGACGRTLHGTIAGCIICDIVMNGMDGYTVLEKLRQHDRTSAIPVIFLSALTEREKVKEAISMRAKGFVIKSFS